MATITASLERSLQNCSLNQTTRSRRTSGLSSSSDSPDNLHQNNHSPWSRDNHDSVTRSNASSSDDNSNFVELNSHVSLPYHWEQCLDLKTGELYYINWRNGMKAKEDPRTSAPHYSGDYCSNEDEDEEEDDDDEDESNCYDSEGSSTESSTCSSTRENLRPLKKLLPANNARYHYHHQQQQLREGSVLVVAGCKSCLMYHMVPKHVEDCPKCSGQLLHFAAQ